MKLERRIISASVGGQGAITGLTIISRALLDMIREGQDIGLFMSEVHGMSQRGGSVECHLSYSGEGVYSPIIETGTADIIWGLDPNEANRYVGELRPGGYIITSSSRHPDAEYDVEAVVAQLQSYGNHLLIDAREIAREAGNLRAENMVMLGAISPYLGIESDLLRRNIETEFGPKGDRIVGVNLDAYDSGREAALESGLTVQDLAQ